MHITFKVIIRETCGRPPPPYHQDYCWDHFHPFGFHPPLFVSCILRNLGVVETHRCALPLVKYAAYRWGAGAQTSILVPSNHYAFSPALKSAHNTMCHPPPKLVLTVNFVGYLFLIYMNNVPFQVIKSLRSSILFHSSGMTNGITEENELEQLPKCKKRELEGYEDSDSVQEDSVDEADVSMLPHALLKFAITTNKCRMYLNYKITKKPHKFE